MKEQRIVVIGGTACGPKAAARARRCNPQARITIIEQGTEVSTATCGLPYYISGAIRSQSALQMRGAAYFKNVLNIDVLTGTRAVKINRPFCSVEVKNLTTGSVSTLRYDKLILATGSTPVLPPLEGLNLAGIFTLSTLDDANAIREYLTRPARKAAIIGSGLVGMEMAEALSARGIEVTIIDTLRWMLPTMFDYEIAAYLAKHVESKGARLLFGRQVTGFSGDSEGRVSKIVMKDDTLEAGLVILAVGRRPSTILAREAGLEIGKTGGIAVNPHLQTSDPDIYAGGDCVENTHLVTGQKVLAPLGSTANKHGRVIGTNISGGSETFPGITGTAIAKIFDYQAARTGLTEQQARDLGYDILTALVPGAEHAGYYPGGRAIAVKLIAEKESGRILGGQVAGPGDAAKRIDVLSSAITEKILVDDLADVDLAYAPPFNSALDPLHNAANVIRNKRDGIARSITPMEVKKKIDNGEDFILLDVRSELEWASRHIEASQSRLIPLDKLRQEMNTLPREAEIITLCQASVRAYQAQRILDGAGFKNVRFMDGSLSIWPYDTTLDDKKADI